MCRELKLSSYNPNKRLIFFKFQEPLYIVDFLIIYLWSILLGWNIFFEQPFHV